MRVGLRVELLRVRMGVGLRLELFRVGFHDGGSVDTFVGVLDGAMLGEMVGAALGEPATAVQMGHITSSNIHG